MNSDPVKEVLSDLFSHLERLETQSTAILLFLKEKKRVTDKQLAPYLERAGNAANVKWRAERVRMEYLLTHTDVLTGAVEVTENESSSPEEQTEQDSPSPTEPQTESTDRSGSEKEEGGQKVA